MENLLKLIFVNSCVLCEVRKNEELKYLKYIYKKSTYIDGLLDLFNLFINYEILFGFNKKTKYLPKVYVCQKCFDCLDFIYNTNCIICDKPTKNCITHAECRIKTIINSCISIFNYNNFIREAIINAKFLNQEFSILQELTKVAIFELYLNGFYFSSNYVIIPIPISSESIKIRDFNQSEVIAKEISKIINCNVLTNVLIKTKKTKHQSKLTRKERFENLNNAFTVKNEHSIKGRKVLLVDDVRTSGATFISAAKTLQKYHVNSIDCFSLSKQPLKITE